MHLVAPQRYVRICYTTNAPTISLSTATYLSESAPESLRIIRTLTAAPVTSHRIAYISGIWLWDRRKGSEELRGLEHALHHKRIFRQDTPFMRLTFCSRERVTSLCANAGRRYCALQKHPPRPYYLEPRRREPRT